MLESEYKPNKTDKNRDIIQQELRQVQSLITQKLIAFNEETEGPSLLFTEVGGYEVLTERGDTTECFILVSEKLSFAPSGFLSTPVIETNSLFNAQLGLFPFSLQKVFTDLRPLGEKKYSVTSSQRQTGIGFLLKNQSSSIAVDVKTPEYKVVYTAKPSINGNHTVKDDVVILTATSMTKGNSKHNATFIAQQKKWREEFEKQGVIFMKNTPAGYKYVAHNATILFIQQKDDSQK